MSDEQPTAARITAPGRSAIATISVDGRGALQLVAALFLPFGPLELTNVDARRIVFGRWGDDDPDAGEEVVVCAHGTDRVEIHCHGGDAAAARILHSLEQAGCRLVTAEDWLGVGDSQLVQREAMLALTRAETTRVAAILLDQWRGALPRQVESLAKRLAEGDHAAVAAQMQALLDRAQWGCRLVKGWQVVLAGRPNVGKSSLINALLGFQRAIVYDQAGTTRDVVSAGTAINGWPVRFSDTAGISPNAESIEAVGIELAWQQVAAADLVIFVSDLADAWSQEDERILGHAGDRALIVHNKSDLVGGQCHGRPAGILTSASRNQGIEQLVTAISTRLVPDPPQPGEAVPFNERQAKCLRTAFSYLNAGHVVGAERELRRITTEDTEGTENALCY